MTGDKGAKSAVEPIDPPSYEGTSVLLSHSGSIKEATSKKW